MAWRDGAATICGDSEHAIGGVGVVDNKTTVRLRGHLRMPLMVNTQSTACKVGQVRTGTGLGRGGRAGASVLHCGRLGGCSSREVGQ